MIMDYLAAMKKQEANGYTCSDYLRNIPKSPDHVDEWCRLKMIEWCFQVIDYINFSRKTVIISVSYLDRFLSSDSPRAKSVMRDRKEYQLAAMTSLYMAIKMFEPTIISTTLLSELSKGGYSSAEFLQMEMDILFGLNWLLSGPTALSFLEIYHYLMPSSISGMITEEIIHYARYQIELSTSDYELAKQNPSNVAIAAVIQGAKCMSSASLSTLNCARMTEELENIVGNKLDFGCISWISNRMEKCNNGMPIIKIRRRTEESCLLSPIENHNRNKVNGSQNSPRGISGSDNERQTCQ